MGTNLLIASSEPAWAEVSRVLLGAGVSDVGAASQAGSVTLDWSTRWVVLIGGLIFVWALLLGTWKYRQIVTSPDGRAHVYVDIAHRAALLYAFATMLLAVFVQFSGWPDLVNFLAALAVIGFFVGAIAGYQLHGMKRDTDNQFVDPAPGLGASMIALIVVEIAGTLVLIAGFVQGQLL